jgi:hypothetical protein
MINRILKITDDRFSNDHLPYVILSVNVFSIESVFQYQRIISSVLYKIMVVIIVYLITIK